MVWLLQWQTTALRRLRRFIRDCINFYLWLSFCSVHDVARTLPACSFYFLAHLPVYTFDVVGSIVPPPSPLPPRLSPQKSSNPANCQGSGSSASRRRRSLTHVTCNAIITTVADTMYSTHVQARQKQASGALAVIQFVRVRGQCKRNANSQTKHS